MRMKSYKDLIVWQKAMELVFETYKLINKLPKEEMYALASQMRRAVISIPSNIAEGQSRKSSKEFVNFLSIAQGSRSELETQLLLCIKLDYLNEEKTLQVFLLLEEVGKMLTTLSQKITINN